MRSRHARIGSVLAALVVFFGYLLRAYMQTTVSDAPSTPVVSAASVPSSSVATSTSPDNGKTNALVLRDVDGDTVVVKQDDQSDEIKVRLLGVNTPESVDPRRPVECFGKEASHFTKEQLEGKRVLLETDPMADDIDKYGRFLRNIFLEDGTDFNAKLVGDGYAYAYIGFPMDKRRKSQLTRLQNEAAAAQRGLWDPKTCNGKK